MLKYQQIKAKPRVLRALTSLDRAEFEALAEVLAQQWQQYRHAHPTPSQPRQRQPGGGRKAALSTTEDKLLFILFYYKTYPLQEVLGFLFGMSQGNACDWIQELSKVLQLALAELDYLPTRQPAALAHVLAECDAEAVAIDGAERRRQRPRDYETQKDYYSGKKHTHTVKNNVIATLDDHQVRYLSATYHGKTQDKKICDQEAPTFPQDTVLYQDKGFQGYAPDGVIIRQPLKKPRGKQLPAEEQVRNGLISSVRIGVEHVIAGIKRCRIVKDVFRNTTTGFDDTVMEIACGLHNFRTASRSQLA